MVSLPFDELKDEYTDLWNSMELGDNANEVESLAQKLYMNRDRYMAVASKVKVPWEFIACTHSLESGCNFKRHLHNGDPLTGRTRQVPSGRPKLGNPPFTWEESAIDAIKLKGLDRINDWSIERLLYELERYNGFGYRLYHPKTLSPYLWSKTNHYTKGKYVADGKWSNTAVSNQVGAAGLLKALYDLQNFTVADIKENSSKLKLTDKTKKSMLAGGFGLGTLFTLDTFNAGIDIVKQISEFVQGNALLLLVGTFGITYVVMKILENKQVNDYREGRYTTKERD